jgi:hypothetical protein
LNFRETTTWDRQKKFLPLLLDTWLASPIEKSGVVIPIEDVVKRRSKTILHIDNSLGISFIKSINGGCHSRTCDLCPSIL